jgi:hypothetical protein
MAISAAIGLIIGAIDAFGFFYTVKLFFARSSGTKKVLAGSFEFLRLIILVAVVFLLAKHDVVPIVPLFITALFTSLIGKTALVVKGLNK